MDQNTPTNGTGSDKRNWRERLGISAKNMPKISDEFKNVPPPALAKAAGKGQQPVAKPAPMAPRAAPAKAAAPESPPPRSPAQEPDHAPNALAEKLRAQRAAAEKLAEQRVSAARERAEAKLAPESAPSPVQRPASATTKKTAQAPPGRPKFTFAEEEFATAKKEIASAPLSQQPILRQGGTIPPPLTPPRPALGGERPQPPLLRPAAAQPQFRPDPPPPYRPIDPATAFPAPRGRAFNPETGVSSYGNRLPSRRGAYDPYRRGPDGAAGYEPSIHSDEPHETRRGRPALPPSADDFGDEFEDEVPRSRHRPSASEYNSAYRDVEDSYRVDRRRSGGPWLLLLALLLAAAAAGGGIWLYQTKFKMLAGPAATDTVPVVSAPEGASKTAAELPADGAPETLASKKLIYDRIVGDQEVSGERMLPAETAPLQPEPQQAGEEMTPAGDSGVLTDESSPLPLPPPPGDNSGDTQGNLDQTRPEDVQRVIAKPVATATDDTAALMPATGEPEPLPAPEPSMEQLAAKAAEPAAVESGAVEPSQPDVPLSTDAAEDQSALTETPSDTVAGEVKKKPAAAAKKKKPAAAEDDAVSSIEPLVLVPPSQSPEIPPPSQGDAAAQLASQQAVQPVQVPAKKKKKTLMDLIKGGDASSSDASASTAAPDTTSQAQNQEVAALPDPAPETATAAPSAGSGYFVQLASFRTEAEAQAEYSRLSSKHSGIVGSLPSRVNQATVSGSTRYRLGLGPLTTREEASRICNSLVAAGERDCLVRRQ